MNIASDDQRGATLVAIVSSIGLGTVLWLLYYFIYMVVWNWNGDFADLIGGWFVFVVFFGMFYLAISVGCWLLLGIPIIVLTRRYQRHDWPTFMMIAAVIAIIILLVDQDFYGISFAITVIGQIAMYLYIWQRQQPASADN